MQTKDEARCERAFASNPETREGDMKKKERRQEAKAGTARRICQDCFSPFRNPAQQRLRRNVAPGKLTIAIVDQAARLRDLSRQH